MNIPPVDATWVQAAYTPANARTPELRAALAISDELIAEIRSVSHCVIGVPMHNFGVPSTLKLWIDQIVRVGETFNYGAGVPVGLLHGISATFITASGGSYGPAEAARSMNFVEPYLRAVFGFIGFQDIDVVSAGGASALMSGSIDRETFMQPHIEAIHTRFAA